MAKRNIDEQDDLVNQLQKVTIHKKAKYVANVIAYADGTESEASSDEDLGNSLPDIFNFDINKPKTWPYKTKKYLDKKSKTGVIGKVSVCEVLPKENDLSNNIIQPLLQLIETTGLENNDQESIQDMVSLSSCLNRMKSLSTRKNNLLKKSLGAKIDSFLTHKEYGIFWQTQWYDKFGKKVQIAKVKDFYKKLKKIDLGKAEIFRKKNEEYIKVPYQELREHLKNHQNTKDLIKEADSQKNDVYLHIIDSDTKSFNGVYSSCNKMHKEANIIPDIMSTGYEFSGNSRQDRPYAQASKLDRLVRHKTSQFFPLGTYYPEPNMCLLVKKSRDTVDESFIDIQRQPGFESAVIIAHIIETRGADEKVIAVFGGTNTNPLITTIPARAKKTLNKKADLVFSDHLQNGGKANAKDMSNYSQITQSKTNPSEFAAALYYNRAFKIAGSGNSKIIQRKIQALMTCDQQEEGNLKQDILDVIGDQNHNIFENKVFLAIFAVKKMLQEYVSDNIRSESLEELYNYIHRKLKLNINDFDGTCLQIIANADILKLLKKEIIDINDLNGLSKEVLEAILYDDGIIEMVRKKEMEMINIIAFLEIFKEHPEITPAYIIEQIQEENFMR